LTVPDLPVEGEGDHRHFTECILDVDGTRLVIETNWSPASPRGDVAEMRAILESIRIEP
jgi:hypothetical protein